MTHELIIQGSGFTEAFQPHFTFEPSMDKDDYVVHVSFHEREGWCNKQGAGIGDSNFSEARFHSVLSTPDYRA